MSKYETPLTRAYWNGLGDGTLYEEFRVVDAMAGVRSWRAVDGVVILGEAHRIASPGERAGVSLDDRDVIVIQTKATRLKHAGITAGDDIEVWLELDTQPREVDLPADFADALSQDSAASQFFRGLSPSQKKWHVQSVESAKTPETRRRRIDKSVELLRQRRAR